MTASDDDVLVFAYDTTLKRPGCVLLQAAMGGDGAHALHEVGFEPATWLLELTPDLRPRKGTRAFWKRVAILTNETHKELL